MKGFAVVTLLLLLAGCGGEEGGNGVEMPDAILQSDPRVMRLEGIVERADTLLASGIHVSYSVSALGETTTDSLVQEVSCSGVTCTGIGVTINLTDPVLTDFIKPDVNLSDSDASLQSRDGFDIAFIRGNLDASEMGVVLPGIAVTETPEGLGYGFWGEHGMAGLTLTDGPFSGRVNDIPFGGDMKVAIPFALGDAAGTNPDGMGNATWTGIAQVVSIRTFRRQEGAATLTIPDLSAPVVTVGINDSDGNPIGKSGWADLPLTAGGFSVGTAGSNYLAGNFHGADHSEAYGVFDTDTFIGAFGAKRQEPPADAQ